LAFGAKPPVFELEKIDDVNEPNSVLPGDCITYEITYGPNGVNHSDVNITDYLPYEVDPNDTDDPNYNSENHTYTWQIGNLDANDSNDTVTLKVRVNEGAAPNSIITNCCEIESDVAYSITTADANVGSWDPNSEIIYVDLLSPCETGTGMAWQYAYRDLQDALERAGKGYGSEIWVAKGTYYTHTDPTSQDWYISFEPADGVGLYGGFAGNETSRNQRNWVANETILEGNIDSDGGSDTDYIITATNLTQNTIIDGFTIRDGYHAGVKIDNSNLMVGNCVIKDNIFDGIRGINLENDSVVNIKNNLIYNNGGNGIYLFGTDYVFLPNFMINNNTIAYNAGYGFTCNGDPSVISCILCYNYYGNFDWYEPYEYQYVKYCCVGDTPVYPGTGNNNYDPCFVDADANNYHLDASSLCIDAGDPYFNPEPNETDIDGEDRKVDGDADRTAIVDIGADEYYGGPADFDKDGIVNFIDYAIFAEAWRSNSPQFSLDDDTDVDFDDFALFCNDWLRQSFWYRTMGSMIMGPPREECTSQSMGRGASGSKNVEPSVEVKSVQLLQFTREEIENILKWLDELWLDPEVQKALDEDDWLEFVEKVESEIR